MKKEVNPVASLGGMPSGQHMLYAWSRIPAIGKNLTPQILEADYLAVS
jgi:hypothetical protein